MTKTEQLEAEALAAGYYRSPNDARRWYAGGPNRPTVAHPLDVHITDAVWLVAHRYGEPADIVPLCRFETFAEYLQYCLDYGTKSKGGSYGNNVTNVWD